MADQMKGRSATPKVNRVKDKSPRSLTGTKPGAPSPRPTDTSGGPVKSKPKGPRPTDTSGGPVKSKPMMGKPIVRKKANNNVPKGSGTGSSGKTTQGKVKQSAAKASVSLIKKANRQTWRKGNIGVE